MSQGSPPRMKIAGLFPAEYQCWVWAKWGQGLPCVALHTPRVCQRGNARLVDSIIGCVKQGHSVAVAMFYSPVHSPWQVSVLAKIPSFSSVAQFLALCSGPKTQS